MVTHQGRNSDPTHPWTEAGARHGGRGAGALIMAALLGVGVGLLAAPQPGTKTRKVLLKRLAAMGEGVGEGLEEVQDVGSKASKRVRRKLARLREEAEDELEKVPERWSRARSRFRDSAEEIEDEDDSGSFGKLLGLAAGLAATYFLTSERAAPVRTRVQETAADVGRRATDQWDRFQRGGTRARRDASESRSETRTSPNPSDEAPQAS
jgi:gas vesicle protein